VNPDAVEGWVGRWKKAETEEGECREAYPPELVFRRSGAYEAPGGIEAGSRLHSGEWRLEEGEEGPLLLLQAANDAMLPFRIGEKREEAFTLEDAAGCRIRYRR